MNTKGFKQMLIGEKMPDKDDPKYKERYERDVRAGRKFHQSAIHGFTKSIKSTFPVQ